MQKPPRSGKSYLDVECWMLDVGCFPILTSLLQRSLKGLQQVDRFQIACRPTARSSVQGWFRDCFTASSCQSAIMLPTGSRTTATSKLPSRYGALTTPPPLAAAASTAV